MRIVGLTLTPAQEQHWVARLAEAEDIANTVAWLVSDAGRYITGVTLPIDAGTTAGNTVSVTPPRV